MPDEFSEDLSEASVKYVYNNELKASPQAEQIKKIPTFLELALNDPLELKRALTQLAQPELKQEKSINVTKLYDAEEDEKGEMEI